MPACTRSRPRSSETRIPAEFLGEIPMLFQTGAANLNHSKMRHTPTSLDCGIGTKWNKFAGEGACKLLKRWWPGTELNRRRQPFQGCLSTPLSGLESVQVDDQQCLMNNGL